jgi:hypothetical protein
MEKVRKESWKEAARLGYPANQHLPLLDEPKQVRAQLEVENRLLALYAVVACAYGFSKNRARAWVESEGVGGSLTNNELIFIRSESSISDDSGIKWRVEGLWALAWALSCHDNLDFSDSCSDDFVFIFPDLKRGEPASRFREKLTIRSLIDITQKCDTAYCLHWGAREMALRGRVIYRSVPINVLVERRRALEWIISDEMWDNISLDT